MKKLNAAKLDDKYADGKSKDETLEIITGLPNFPKYDEYETVVGKRPEMKDTASVRRKEKEKSTENDQSKQLP